MIGSLNPARIFHQMVQGSVRSYMVKSKPHAPNRTMTQTPYTVTVTIMPENGKSTYETKGYFSEGKTLTGLEDGIRAEIMIEALTLRGFEDRIRAKITIDALTLRGLEDGLQAEIMIEALTLRGLEDGI